MQEDACPLSMSGTAAGPFPCRCGARGPATGPALEARSYECYAVVKEEYDRLLPDIKAT